MCMMRIGVRSRAATPITPCAERNLGAHARRFVAAARDRVEPLRGASSISTIACRMPSALVERRRALRRAASEVGAVRDALARSAHRREHVALRRRRGQRVAGTALDVEHAIDVRALQPEHAAHAGVRRDAGELAPSCARTAARRSRCAGTRAQAGSAPHVSGSITSEAARGLASTFCARLVEELERQRDVPARRRTGPATGTRRWACRRGRRSPRCWEPRLRGSRGSRRASRPRR